MVQSSRLGPIHLLAPSLWVFTFVKQIPNSCKVFFLHESNKAPLRLDGDTTKTKALITLTNPLRLKHIRIWNML